MIMIVRAISAAIHNQTCMMAVEAFNEGQWSWIYLVIQHVCPHMCDCLAPDSADCWAQSWLVRMLHMRNHIWLPKWLFHTSTVSLWHPSLTPNNICCNPRKTAKKVRSRPNKQSRWWAYNNRIPPFPPPPYLPLKQIIDSILVPATPAKWIIPLPWWGWGFFNVASKVFGNTREKRPNSGSWDRLIASVRSNWHTVESHQHGSDCWGWCLIHMSKVFAVCGITALINAPLQQDLYDKCYNDLRVPVGSRIPLRDLSSLHKLWLMG